MSTNHTRIKVATAALVAGLSLAQLEANAARPSANELNGSEPPAAAQPGAWRLSPDRVCAAADTEPLCHLRASPTGSTTTRPTLRHTTAGRATVGADGTFCIGHVCASAR